MEAVKHSDIRGAVKRHWGHRGLEPSGSRGVLAVKWHFCEKRWLEIQDSQIHILYSQLMAWARDLPQPTSSSIVIPVLLSSCRVSCLIRLKSWGWPNYSTRATISSSATLNLARLFHSESGDDFVQYWTWPKYSTWAMISALTDLPVSANQTVNFSEIHSHFPKTPFTDCCV